MLLRHGLPVCKRTCMSNATSAVTRRSSLSCCANTAPLYAIRACLFMNNPEDEVQTSRTTLVVAPLATPSAEPQQWQLLYINSIAFRAATAGAPKLPLMIVPVPNPHCMQETDFTLFALPHTVAASITSSVASLASPYHTGPLRVLQTTGSASSGPPSVGGAPSLLLQQVSDYNVVVAPTLLDLETRAPWDRFGVRGDHAARILQHMRAKYERGFAFVMTIGRPEIDGGPRLITQRGFGILYRDARENGCFFPTSHEPAVGPDGQASPLAAMDVTCVALGGVIKSGSILSPDQYESLELESIDGGLPWGVDSSLDSSQLEQRPVGHVLLRGDDTQCRAIVPKWRAVADLVRDLPVRGSGPIHENVVVAHEEIRVASIWKLEGNYENSDVLCRKATDIDAAVVNRCLHDVDSWLVHRSQVPCVVVQKSVFGSPFRTSLYFCSPIVHRTLQSMHGALAEAAARMGKVDLALAFLARQLADPGIDDRVSDVACPRSKTKRRCGHVAYMNLDLANADLDEACYQGKDTFGRFLSTLQPLTDVDTLGMTYLRISATLGKFENLGERTVQPHCAFCIDPNNISCRLSPSYGM
jgi:hypothetical protein